MEAEFYYRDEDGKKRDAGLHDAMLDDAGADAAFAKAVIDNAIKNGMPPEEARRLYGPRGSNQ